MSPTYKIPSGRPYSERSRRPNPQPYLSTPSPSFAASSYPNSTRRPLIDSITNEWRNNPHLYDSSDTSEEDEPWIWEKPVWAEHTRRLKSISPKRVPRRVQRWMCVYLMLVIVVAFSWKMFFESYWKQLRDINWGLDARNQDVFGNNMQVEVSGMVKIQELDSNLLPDAEEPNKRLIFIGDVHGCRTELVKLLKKVHHKHATDHIIFTGDLIAKGPDSAGVIKLARELGASSVRGNHEDRVLVALEAQRQSEAASSAFPNRPSYDIPDDEPPNAKALKLAASFTRSDLDWLRTLPVVLQVGYLPGMGDVSVVHAGLAPKVPLQEQDWYQCMNMRTIDPKTGLPSSKRDGVCWADVWNNYQKTMPKHKRHTVIYGHDSPRGLSDRRWSKGLDTGCVKGERLTALVVSVGKKGKSVEMDYSNVKCENHLDDGNE